MATHIQGSLIAAANGASGPSVFNQGAAIGDVRSLFAPGASGPGQIRAFLPSNDIIVMNAAPAAAGAAKIAAAATAVSGTAMTLVTAAAAGISPNTPMMAFNGSSSLIQRLIGLDMGFATASTTAASATITMSGVFARIKVGTALAIGMGAANGWQTAMVKSVSGTTVVLDTVAGATVAAAPVALGNVTSQTGIAPTVTTPFVSSGIVSVFDDRSATSRGISVTSNNAADTGWTVTVRGFDVYGYPVTEALPVTANGIAYGVKTFKFIASVTPSKSGGGSSTGTLSIGTSDSFGLALRTDAWETVTLYYAGGLITASTGFTAADATNPATGTTGDTRGRVQIGTIGPLGAGVAGGATDGTRRIVVSMTLTVDNLTAATNSNPVAMFGVAHYAA